MRTGFRCQRSASGYRASESATVTVSTPRARPRRSHGPVLCGLDLLAPLSAATVGVELGVAALAAGVAVSWDGRPRGSSATDLIQVRESSVAGRGVFAAASIPKGTVLGCYPGRLRTPGQMALKATTAANAKGYCFLNGRGMYLDPTDEKGQVSQQPSPGTPWPFPVDVTLAFINEPNAGQAICNVTAEDDSNSDVVKFVVMKDISLGEELFIDYGQSYDRSLYDSPDSQ